jgi:hypothetical protein
MNGCERDAKHLITDARMESPLRLCHTCLLQNIKALGEQFPATAEEYAKKAPVIDISTRKVIGMKWAIRYATSKTQNSYNSNLNGATRTGPAASDSVGSHLLQMYNVIWPEGPKTMASDANNIAKIMIDPAKRQMLKTIPGVAGAYVKDKINRAKNVVKGLTPEGLDRDTGLIPSVNPPSDDTDTTMDVY